MTQPRANTSMPSCTPPSTPPERHGAPAAPAAAFIGVESPTLLPESAPAVCAPPAAGASAVDEGAVAAPIPAGAEAEEEGVPRPDSDRRREVSASTSAAADAMSDPTVNMLVEAAAGAS